MVFGDFRTQDIIDLLYASIAIEERCTDDGDHNTIGLARIEEVSQKFIAVLKARVPAGHDCVDRFVQAVRNHERTCNSLHQIGNRPNRTAVKTAEAVVDAEDGLVYCEEWMKKFHSASTNQICHETYLKCGCLKNDGLAHRVGCSDFPGGIQGF
jgi:hypothetical protein